MTIEEILLKKEILDSKPEFSTSDIVEYKQCIQELDAKGCSKNSHALSPEMRQYAVSDIPENLLPGNIKLALTRSGITNLAQLVDMTRDETKEIRGFGAKKWLCVHAFQKKMQEETSCLLECHETEETRTYSSQDMEKFIEKVQLSEEQQLTGRLSHKDRQDYDSICDLLKRNGYKRSTRYSESPLNEITIADLDDSHCHHQIRNTAARMGLVSLPEILDITCKDLEKLAGKGHKTWLQILKLKKQIQEAPQQFLDFNEKFVQIHEVPEFREESVNLPFAMKYDVAYVQMLDFISSINFADKDRYMFYVKEYLGKGSDTEYIKGELANIGKSVSTERARQLIVEYTSKLLTGSRSPFVSNIYFSDNFLKEIEQARNDYAFKPLSYMTKVSGAEKNKYTNPKAILNVLSLSLFEKTKEKVWLDEPYVLPLDFQRGNFSKQTKAVFEVLKQEPIPLAMDVILDKACAELQSTYPQMDWLQDKDILEKIVQHYSRVEKQETSTGTYYQLAYRYLPSNVIKCARIVYERKHVTHQEFKDVNAKYMGEYDDMFTQGISKMTKTFSWIVPEGKTGYKYNESAQNLLPIREAIKVYAEKHKMFRLNDLIKELRQSGYMFYSDRSIRSYAVCYCRPSNNDGDLFCHNDYLNNYYPGTWRKANTYGVLNQFINSAVQYLLTEPKHKMQFHKLRELLANMPENSEYNFGRIEQYRVDKFTDLESDEIKNNIFYKDDKNNLYLNKQVYDSALVDLTKIGRIDKQPDYYMDVMTQVMAELKESPNYECRLSDLAKACYPIFQDQAPKNIFYRIVKRLPEEVVRIERDGDVFLKLIEKSISYEPAYTVNQTAPLAQMAEQESAASMDAMPENLPSIQDVQRPQNELGHRIRFDWNSLCCSMSQELKYVGERWWDLPVSFQDAIQRFAGFLKECTNQELKDYLPQSLYEFWNFRVDKYDLHNYLIQLLTNYEGLIRQIYIYNNNMPEPRTSGLDDCVKLVPEMKTWIEECYSSTVNNSLPFKAFKQLKRYRNMKSHGVDLQLNTFEKYQYITNFIGLYIYTYARFVKA